MVSSKRTQIFVSMFIVIIFGLMLFTVGCGEDDNSSNSKENSTENGENGTNTTDNSANAENNSNNSNNNSENNIVNSVNSENSENTGNSSNIANSENSVENNTDNSSNTENGSNSNTENGSNGNQNNSIDPLAPGSECNCDSDCQGTEANPGICVYGICMNSASGQCSASGSTEECGDGSRCWGLQGQTGFICWPDCDAYECAGECDADGSCLASSGMSCDAECGSYCGVSSNGNNTNASGPIGTACERDANCGEASCYLSEGWVDGYCLFFGCPTAGEACGEGGICVAELTTDGTNICMGDCSETECRQGYNCVENGGNKFCMAGCANNDDCPTGFICQGEICIVDLTCSEDRPFDGECPDGQVCNNGECIDFVCDEEPTLEPNESLDAAIEVTDKVENLQICDGDHDWYLFKPNEADTLFQFGIDYQYGSGDLDSNLVLQDGTIHHKSKLLPGGYHDENPRGPMNIEAMSLVGNTEASDFFFHVFGFENAINNYNLIFEKISYKDGAKCQDEGFSKQDCRALTTSGAEDKNGYIMFPASYENDPFIGNGVFFESGLGQAGNPGYVHSSNTWARRELVMAIRYAINAVEEAYPGTAPLGVGEISMPNGTTPWGHPNNTHDYGGNVDLAYYINPEKHREWGNMVYRQICNDATRLNDWSAVGTETTGCCVAGSEDTHIVDIPRTALLIAKIAETGRIRVFGVDTAIEADLDAEYDRLKEEGIINATTHSNVKGRQATANDDSSWVWHFNHIHLSLCFNDC